jgi:hypothetical protein
MADDACVALPRGVRLSLDGGGAALLGGLIGLTWWLHRLRRGPLDRPRPRGRRVLVALGAVVLVLAGVGIVWRSKVAFDNVAVCRAPSGAQPEGARRPTNAALLAEKTITWPETGVGMLYGEIVGASQCWYPPDNYYVDFHSGRYAGARIMNVGDVTLTPPFDTSVHSGEDVAAHEARHRTQWAVVTAIGGPLAFPILYGIDDFFFPGSRNHFERLAGPESGRYEDAGIAPVIGWPQLVVLLAVGALIVVFVYRRLRRRSAYRVPAPEAQEDRSG